MENKSTCIPWGIKIDTFFILKPYIFSMDKPEKKSEDKIFDDKEDKTELLDGKSLHDLYRHTTKLIK